MRFLYDTSVLIHPPANPPAGEISISAASLAELHYGVLVARTPAVRAERLLRLGVIEHTFAALPVDDVVARHYGEMAAALDAAGRTPRRRVMDLLIAATAAAHGARLATRNSADLLDLRHLVEIISVS